MDMLQQELGIRDRFTVEEEVLEEGGKTRWQLAETCATFEQAQLIVGMDHTTLPILRKRIIKNQSITHVVWESPRV